MYSCRSDMSWLNKFRLEKMHFPLLFQNVENFLDVQQMFVNRLVNISLRNQVWIGKGLAVEPHSLMIGTSRVHLLSMNYITKTSKGSMMSTKRYFLTVLSMHPYWWLLEWRLSWVKWHFLPPSCGLIWQSCQPWLSMLLHISSAGEVHGHGIKVPYNWFAFVNSVDFLVCIETIRRQEMRVRLY